MIITTMKKLLGVSIIRPDERCVPVYCDIYQDCVNGTLLLQVRLHNSHCDVSMCIDSPGSTGFGYYPHVAVPEKSSEPARQFLFKTKATAVKIHGIGTWLAQTYPTLETQGERTW
jgi:hypothetical protein